ncbi:MAG: DUF1064 domain-containing protein [Candidatus Moranbacteria bacterium]|nr:DUF1064 domain-containing protein [Candidatus Moranbacteria bacterium]
MKFALEKSLKSKPKRKISARAMDNLRAPKAKYGNTKVAAVANGEDVVFDSRAEHERYQYLRLLEKAGAIAALGLQPKFELEPGFVRDGKKYRQEWYIADFSYRRDGRAVIEDVKGKKTDLYLSKVKRFLAQNPDLIFIEAYRDGKGWREVVK